MTAHELKKRGFYDAFDPVLLSCDEHVAKPDRAFFELALKRLGLPGGEVLFIDDQDRFRPLAEGLDMHFILAISPAQIIQDVKDRLLKENNLRLE
jgi:HAD superfamily hydrolase (TIGR01509 family)